LTKVKLQKKRERKATRRRKIIKLKDNLKRVYRYGAELHYEEHHRRKPQNELPAKGIEIQNKSEKQILV
jgi:hypothetical protein